MIFSKEEMRKSSKVNVVLDAKEVSKGLMKTEGIRQDLLNEVRDLINDFSGNSESSEYYDLILGDWLLLYSHTVYVAWMEVNSLGGACPGCQIPKIYNSSNFLTLIETVHWQQHLQGIISEVIDGKPVEGFLVEDDGYSQSSSQNQGIIRKIVAKRFSSSPAIILANVCIEAPILDKLKIDFRWRNWASRFNFNNELQNSFHWDWSWRKSQSTKLALNALDYQSIAKALLPLYIPGVLLEGFNQHRAAVESLGISRPRMLFTNSALHGNHIFKFLAAEWRKSGTKLLSQQHGGGYGLEQNLAVEDYEMRVSDKFYTWGWRRDGFNCATLGPAIQISNRNYQGSKIVLNCLDLPQVPYRLMHAPMPGSIQEMHNETVIFLRQIAYLRDIEVRPYPSDYGWGVIQRMKAVAPGATFSRKERSLSAFSNARLVVHNYLGTAWLQTLGLNIPTICFFNPSIYTYRNEADLARRTLESVGILHHSGLDAAHFVSSIANDIDGWWNRVEVQNARREFVSQYANISSDWSKEWEDEFLSVLDA